MLKDVSKEGIHSQIVTVSEVSVKAGGSISIPCRYGSQYINHVKYLCKGKSWSKCSFVVRTDKPQNSGKFSISDDTNQTIFTVTIKDLTDEDTDYWCAVEINGGSDVKEYFHLSVTSGTPSLYVDKQKVAAFEGGSVTVGCRHEYADVTNWCRLGGSCVAGLNGSINGTKVTINASVPNVFTVTMSELRMESGGWYWCDKGDFQMPVHITGSPIGSDPDENYANIVYKQHAAAQQKTEPVDGSVIYSIISAN
ncbi:polymeric immunoglobulin receptor-like [Sebastes umbrosus]|uniref:polymeric immunoglobulin receptor-like n=1 Tax=Sebastes umbrosus TaxID=72105 RepID=UPI00189CE7F5|nr:polymeric immunoglobulin receptor-like [Sebastes umbrosus]